MASAFEDELIPTNPAASKRIKITSRGKTERTALTPEQVTDIIRQIDTKLKGDDERRMITLFLFTGMRRGEVLGLRWEDIDFEKKLITVSRAVSYTTNQPIVSEPKTQSGKRTIPLNDQLVEFLKPLQDSGYVVGREAPPTQMVYRRIERHIFQKVDTFGATPHVFRHSYISAMAEAGIDLKTLQYISGHSNVTTTMGIYAHTRLGLVQEAGDKVGELLRQ
jgi:integrase